MNRASLTAEIRRLVKDTNSDSSLQRWTDVVLQARENYIQEEMMATADVLEARATDIDVVSGTSEYTFPITLLSVKQVLIEDANSKYSAISSISEKELDLRSVSWREDTGTPSYYYLSRGYIGLYPKPDYSRTGGLRVDGILKSVDMTSDSDVPFNSDYRFYFAHMGLCYGVARLCQMDEGKWNDVAMYQKLYQDAIKGMRSIASTIDEDIRISNVYELTRATARRTR